MQTVKRGDRFQVDFNPHFPNFYFPISQMNSFHSAMDCGCSPIFLPFGIEDVRIMQATEKP